MKFIFLILRCAIVIGLIIPLSKVYAGNGSSSSRSLSNSFSYNATSQDAKPEESDSKDDYGYTALHRAVLTRDKKSLRRLIDQHANIESLDSRNCTPLALAASNGYIDGVKQLLQAGAKINVIDKYGYTPLKLASRNHHNKIVAILLMASAES